jgi:hypothetical protein
MSRTGSFYGRPRADVEIILAKSLTGLEHRSPATRAVSVRDGIAFPVAALLESSFWLGDRPGFVAPSE